MQLGVDESDLSQVTYFLGLTQKAADEYFFHVFISTSAYLERDEDFWGREGRALVTLWHEPDVCGATTPV